MRTVEFFARGFSENRQPFETPFDKHGRPERPGQFIYQSNRQQYRYSGILVSKPNLSFENPSLNEYFPMGYSNQFVFDLRYTIHPNRLMEDPFLRQWARNHGDLPPIPNQGDLPVDRLKWVNRVFCVIQEPGIQAPLRQDMQVASTEEEEALKMGVRFSVEKDWRCCIGFMVEDVGWH